MQEMDLDILDFAQIVRVLVDLGLDLVPVEIGLPFFKEGFCPGVGRSCGSELESV